MSPEEALERLMVGNRRYAAMRQIHPRQTMIHRQLLIDGQAPIATILSCSDSRAPAELIFDQGLGDLFIVRTAGHAVDKLVVASLEYSVFALNVPLILVLGHASCGAVTAALKGQELPGNLPFLINHLQAPLAGIDPSSSDALEQAIRANSRFTADHVTTKSQILAEAHDRGTLKIAPAYYDLMTGRVEAI
jgi:carbonic anhydrase